ncbi:MAG TPA: hypothetical protein VFR39_07490 [Burkholderiales bacterium]|nr:hypothetical protein [Burkholderiales bacterium]
MALNEINPGGTPESAERDSGLDRLYRATGREEPPARLDAAILAAAHREVGARPRTRPHAPRRWQVPVSIAAVVVLSVSLVTVVREEGGEQLLHVPPPPSMPDVAQSPPLAAPAQPPVAQPAPSAPAVSERQLRPSVATPDPARAARREDTRASDAPVTLGNMTDRSAGGPAGSVVSPSAGALSAPDSAGLRQPQPFRDAPSPAERRAVAPQATAPAEDLAARAPATAERSVAPKVAAPAPKPAAAPLAKAMLEARKEAASADAPAPVWQGFEKEPPQRWLDRIAELRRLERVADADAMLVEFKRRFPSHPLPPALP